MKVRAIHRTQQSNGIVATLRILNGKGWLGYCYATSQDIVEVEGNRATLMRLVEWARYTCKEQDAILYSY